MTASLRSNILQPKKSVQLTRRPTGLTRRGVLLKLLSTSRLLLARSLH